MRPWSPTCRCSEASPRHWNGSVSVNHSWDDEVRRQRGPDKSVSCADSFVHYVDVSCELCYYEPAVISSRGWSPMQRVFCYPCLKLYLSAVVYNFGGRSELLLFCYFSNEIQAKAHSGKNLCAFYNQTKNIFFMERTQGNGSKWTQYLHLVAGVLFSIWHPNGSHDENMQS